MRKENKKVKPLFRRAVEFIKNALSSKETFAHHPDYVAEKLISYLSSPDFGEELFVGIEDVA